MIVKDLKESLVEGNIYSYAWLPMERMWTDLITKEKRLPQDFEYVLMRNDMILGDISINEVRAFGQEVRMENICNCRAVDVTDGEWILSQYIMSLFNNVSNTSHWLKIFSSGFIFKIYVEM